ncbi:MAG: hypothetical protein R8L07_00420 [Alphaproteobacteria bacterium]|nr:hypothetical protein [Alphaproteobacteria bacterium]
MSDDTINTSGRLTVLAPLGFAMHEAFGYVGTYFRAARLPLAIVFVLALLTPFLSPYILDRELFTIGHRVGWIPTEMRVTVHTLVFELVFLLPMTPALAIWLRMGVEGRGQAQRETSFPFGGREIRLLIALILTGVVLSVGMALLATTVFDGVRALGRDAQWLAVPAMILSLAAFGYVLSHFIPAVVGSALGDRIGIGRSWRLARGSGIIVVLAFIMFVIVCLLIFALFGFVVTALGFLLADVLGLGFGFDPSSGSYWAYLIFFTALGVFVEFFSTLMGCLFFARIYQSMRPGM